MYDIDSSVAKKCTIHQKLQLSVLYICLQVWKTGSTPQQILATGPGSWACPWCASATQGQSPMSPKLKSYYIICASRSKVVLWKINLLVKNWTLFSNRVLLLVIIPFNRKLLLSFPPLIFGSIKLYYLLCVSQIN